MATRNVPSKPVLINKEVLYKANLRADLLKVHNLTSNDAQYIRQEIVKLKSANNTYSEASRALSKWFLKHGSLQESSDVRHDRLILHEEVDEGVKHLNALLNELGDENLESELGDYTSVVSVRRNSEQSVSVLGTKDDCYLYNSEVEDNTLRPSPELLDNLQHRNNDVTGTGLANNLLGLTLNTRVENISQIPAVPSLGTSSLLPPVTSCQAPDPASLDHAASINNCSITSAVGPVGSGNVRIQPTASFLHQGVGSAAFGQRTHNVSLPPAAYTANVPSVGNPQYSQPQISLGNPFPAHANPSIVYTNATNHQVPIQSNVQHMGQGIMGNQCHAQTGQSIGPVPYLGLYQLPIQRNTQHMGQGVLTVPPVSHSQVPTQGNTQHMGQGGLPVPPIGLYQVPIQSNAQQVAPGAMGNQGYAPTGQSTGPVYPTSLYQVPGQGNTQYASQGALDATARQFLKVDLIKGLGEPFDGSCHKFWAWYTYINSRFIEACLDPLDIIHALRANTKGRPQQLISSYIDSGITNPGFVVKEIWDTLKRRYGSNDQVSNNLRDQMRKTDKIKSEDDIDAMEDLHGLCKVIASNANKCASLNYFLLPEGMREIWERMPDPFIKKWRTFYCERQDNGYTPTFDDLMRQMLKFINTQANPMFKKNIATVSTAKKSRVLKTETNAKTQVAPRESWNQVAPRESKNQAAPREARTYCSYHDKSTHAITDCKSFNKLTFDEKKQHAIDHKLCFRCLRSHRSAQCKSKEKCRTCGGLHITAMHRDKPTQWESASRDRTYERDRSPNPESSRNNTQNLCTSVCGGGSTPKICSKTVPVELRIDGGETSLKCLAIIDEQSNSTFVDEKILDLLQIPSEFVQSTKYTLTTIDRLNSTVHSSKVNGLVVKGVSKNQWIKLPPSLTHPGLPDTSSELGTPTIVSKHPHIKQFAKYFPPEDPSLEVLLLIGTNCGEAMRTRCYGNTFPFVHDMALGYALVGPCCLVDSDGNSRTRALRTAVTGCEHFLASGPLFDRKTELEPSGPHDVFLERADDELPGLSRDDDEFLRIVSQGIRTNENGCIEIPLPLKRNAQPPDNQKAIFKRSTNTLSRLRRDPQKLKKCTEIMSNYLKHGHVDELSDEKSVSTRHFIPVFPVENESKGKVRLVFDSSAKFQGTSLNDCLLQGPDETNRLIGVLVRFRQEEVAVSADIECMFHSFFVPPSQRDLQCFFWWKGNNSKNELGIFRANVHVFGHTSSPSVANFGLRYTTTKSPAHMYPDACDFIFRNFYVDDGLRSEKTVSDAISTLKHAREILSTHNIRLHKIVSTNSSVLQSFPASEIAQDVDSVDLNQSSAQHALGITWQISRDVFQLRCRIKRKEFTKRAVLSVNGSLFDPLGIACPVALLGKILQRKLFQASPSGSTNREDWDDPLPVEFLAEWDAWVKQLDEVNCLELRRCYHPAGFGNVIRDELHIFCDASQDSIAHVIYLRQIDEHGNVSVSFVFASARVAPRAATSIPRLELCAAVGAAHSAQYIRREFMRDVHLMQFYSDSNIVLGYLTNRTRRFSRYVTSRVQRVLAVSSPEQWQYISTDKNPADIATRPHTPSELAATSWLTGPEFLYTMEALDDESEGVDELPETLKDARVLLSAKQDSNALLDCFMKFSTWDRMCAVATYVLYFIAKLKRQEYKDEYFHRAAKCFIIRKTQEQAFSDLYKSLVTKKPILESDNLASLDPFLDDESIIRVGGRLQHGDVPYAEKHPVLLPHSHPVTLVILRYYHESSHHQGRHITTAALRQGGFHIHKPRSIISSFLKSCVTCIKMRGAFQTQQMAVLPPDRIERIAPFERVGLDVFGYYLIHDGKSTRRTNATKKIWVLLFTCLYSRAVHLECLNSLDTPTFLNAFRRFVAIRGKCTLIRSDHGTNFIGAIGQMDNHVNIAQLEEGIKNEGCVWKLVPPNASHFAGVWERKVGAVKKVLSAAIGQAGSTCLSRDDFSTLLQEAGCIVNKTPLSEISCDPTEPFPVSPSVLLMHREDNEEDQDSYTKGDLLQYGKKRWRRVQRLAEEFWVRWKRDFMSSLQRRNKWKLPVRNLREGDVVLLRDTSPRNQWPMGVVVKSSPGLDGLVRRVVLRLKPSSRGTDRFMERAIHDLVLLVPCHSDNVTA